MRRTAFSALSLAIALTIAPVFTLFSGSFGVFTALSDVYAATPENAPDGATGNATRSEGTFAVHDARTDIDMRYPTFANAAVSADVRQWAHHLADAFRAGLEEEEPLPFKSTLKVGYTVSHPSPAAVSITFDVYTYTGGAHGNLDLITVSYALDSGRRLTLDDIFGDVETALARMSAFAYANLASSLGDMRVDDMLRSGTTPDVDNYSSIALTPDGIRIHFQPYQVAPWAAGPQHVDMSLDELAEADPHRELWGH